MKYIVTATYSDGEVQVAKFDTATAAREFCEEEVKWEGVERVVCPELGFDETGDFA